ncbi:conjugal transfer protein TraF [Colwellia sp. D2M02]|uniref:conjugal transfer protein TraF n=1 Tax=Colwellia sp. D2M02 TaxID=2841562 RepID=UPI0020901A5A|nr:conjugal transfer protein TraF [Colwellia sp. D2M02]
MTYSFLMSPYTINKPLQNVNIFFITSLLLLLIPIKALANSHPSGGLNYSQRALTNAGNPAAAALVIERNDPYVMTGGIIEFGAGLEYGDLDELFAKIDDISSQFSPSEDEGTPGSPPSLENPIRDYTWEDLFQAYPELEDRIDVLEDKVLTTAGVLALITTEGYGKAEAIANASFVLSDDFYGGSLLFSTDFKGNAKAVGIFEDINFDSEQARTQLKTIPDFNESDPVQALDLSGGITLFYNPANQKVKLSIDNDSLLLVKATTVFRASLAYSAKALSSGAGNLYWGVKPNFYRVGLTNVSTRLGDVTDSEALFNDIKDADLIYENGFDIDLGLVWATDNYQVGASVTNLIENTYEYPELEDDFNSLQIIRKLSSHKSFTMQRQVKLEAGIYTDDRQWSLNAELDANPTVDPMKDRYQWLTITGGYANDSWWLPSARIGFSRNLAGSQLSYLNAGITVMKFINIDVASTLDTVTLDGEKWMRGAHIQIGFQFDY